MERKKKTTNDDDDSSSLDKDRELEGSESGMAKGEDDDDDDDEGDGEGEGDNKVDGEGQGQGGDKVDGGDSAPPGSQLETQPGKKKPTKLHILVPGKFRTRPAAWESQLVSSSTCLLTLCAYRGVQLREFKDYLDKQPDTCKGANQAYKCVHGKKKEKEKPRVFTFEGRCRRWMIDPVWWEKTGESKYDEPLQVAANGHLWGEEDDPEEEAERVKALEVEKKAVKRQHEEEAKASNANKKVKRG
jgi:hypothetical protein